MEFFFFFFFFLFKYFLSRIIFKRKEYRCSFRTYELLFFHLFIYSFFSIRKMIRDKMYPIFAFRSNFSI